MSDSNDIDAAMVLFSLRTPPTMTSSAAPNFNNVKSPTLIHSTESIIPQSSNNSFMGKDCKSSENVRRPRSRPILITGFDSASYYPSQNAPRNMSVARFFGAQGEENSRNSAGDAQVVPTMHRNSPPMNTISDNRGHFFANDSYSSSQREEKKMILPSLPSMLGTIGYQETSRHSMSSSGSEMMDISSPSRTEWPEVPQPIHQFYPSPSAYGCRATQRFGSSSVEVSSNRQSYTAYPRLSEGTVIPSPANIFASKTPGTFEGHACPEGRQFIRKGSYHELMAMIPIVDPKFLKSGKRTAESSPRRRKRNISLVSNDCKEKTMRQELALKRVRVQGRFVKQSPAFIPISCMQSSMTIPS